jgi:hypothetical protein
LGHCRSRVLECPGMSHFRGVTSGHHGVTWRWRWVGIARRELERGSDSKSKAEGRKSAQAEHTTIAIGALLFLVLASLEFPTRSYWHRGPIVESSQLTTHSTNRFFTSYSCHSCYSWSPLSAPLGQYIPTVSLFPFTFLLLPSPAFLDFTPIAMEKARKKIARFQKKSKIIRPSDEIIGLTSIASRGGVKK